MSDSASAPAVAPSVCDVAADSVAPPPHFRLRGPFIRRSGYSWIARLPFEFEADAGVSGAPRRSQWQLLENGVPLQHPHSAHSDIAEFGAGRYSHWMVQLYFSSSDNTDPNANGRGYGLRWTGVEDKPWLREIADVPVAEPAPFSPRPDIQDCSGLIAIFGASFSGSTLLNTVLGAHPEIFGGGELHWLINDLSQSECAVCGNSCRFWTPEVRASAKLSTLYHETSRLFGRPYVVDISKMTSWFSKALDVYPDLPVVRVLLVKHPVRHVASFFKKRSEFSAYGDQDLTLSELRAFYQELRLPKATPANEDAPEIGADTIDFVIRYEDFVASPKTTLAPVLARLGLEFHPRMEMWASAEHHHIGGNVGPLVQIANSAPTLAVSARKYRQRGIFLDNSYTEILAPEDILRIARNPDARWIGRVFGYGDIGTDDELRGPSGRRDLTTTTPGALGEQLSVEGEVLALEPPFRNRGGFGWSVLLPESLATEGDTRANNFRSTWRLLEDDVPIGSPHIAHSEISELGKGRHSHWGDVLYLSTRDNSDPNTNGRRYALAKPSALPQEDLGTAELSAMKQEANRKSGLTADTLEPDTHIPIAEQIERVRLCIGEDEPLRMLYDVAIGRLDIARNEALIRQYGMTKGLSSPLKYLDCSFWIFHKLRMALSLGLDRAPPQQILDLGAGGGHFGFACQMLGHDVTAVDIEVPMFRDICALLGVSPLTVEIVRGTRLPDFGKRFDLITAFAAQFDHVGPGERWSKGDWREFVSGLIADHIRIPGRIFFTLNSLYDPITKQAIFKEYVAEVFREYDGCGDPSNTSVDLKIDDAVMRIAVTPAPASPSSMSNDADGRAHSAKGAVPVLGLGSCLLWQPLEALIEAGRVKSTILDAGLGQVPAAYCLDDAIQFVRFLIGEFDIPIPLRPVCDVQPEWQWQPAWRNGLSNCEVVLLEIHSPIRIGWGPYSLVRGEILNHITNPLIAHNEALRKPVGTWWNQGLMAGKEELRAEAGAILASAVPDTMPNAEVARAILRDARPHRRTETQLVEALTLLKRLLDRPIGVLTAIHRYLPDGRLVPWPAKYLEEATAAARRADLPLFQPSDIVQRYGVADAWKFEAGSYREEFRPVLGDALLRFIKDVNNTRMLT